MSLAKKIAKEIKENGVEDWVYLVDICRAILGRTGGNFMALIKQSIYYAISLVEKNDDGKLVSWVIRKYEGPYLDAVKIATVKDEIYIREYYNTIKEKTKRNSKYFQMIQQHLYSLLPPKQHPLLGNGENETKI